MYFIYKTDKHIFGSCKEYSASSAYSTTQFCNNLKNAGCLINIGFNNLYLIFQILNNNNYKVEVIII